jgi:hypothetical protein
MVNKTKSIKLILICLYAIIVSFWSYRCTRGPDGNLVATVVGFCVLATIYWIIIFLNSPMKLASLAKHLLLFEFGVTISLSANPELEEMGGILNIIIPIIVFIIVIMGLIPSRMRRRNVEKVKMGSELD